MKGVIWEECQPKNQFKGQSVYLETKHCNSGYTNLGRNPNNVLITGDEDRVFMGKKKRLG